jgi:hypothetical protein
MARLTKEEKLRRISNANAMLAECGMLEHLAKHWSNYCQTEAEFSRWAAKLWLQWLKRGQQSRKYKKLHGEYLASPEWKAKRSARLEIDGQTCKDCGGAAECVHHLTYERWKSENVERDLVSLCNDCHYRRHFA